MIKHLQFYGRLLQPWLTVVVYLWSLQLMADFSIEDPEPLLDRIADCAAILWTLLLWMAMAVVVVWLIALILKHDVAIALNDRGAMVVLILLSAFFFVRWLFNWVIILKDSNVVLYALLVLCILIASWAWQRRKHKRSLSAVLSWSDTWSYLVFPTLIVTASVIIFKVGENTVALRANRGVVKRAAEHAQPADRLAPRPNVVMIVADSLRAQSMSVYGYGRKTTPFLEKFAEKSIVYTQVYSNSTSTRTSMTSILTGKHPLTHGRLTKFMPAYDSSQNIIAMLRDIGYTTAAITSNSDASLYSVGLNQYLVYGEYPNYRRLTLSWLRNNGIYLTSSGERMYGELASWMPFLGYPDTTLFYGPAQGSFDLARRVIAVLPQPFLLLVHIHEPHDPYDTPPPFRGKYARVSYREAFEKISSGYARYPPEAQPFVDVLRDYYDECIEYFDYQISRFVEYVDQTLKAENLLLIVTADHGESFERGFLNHGEDLYQSSIHVPLIIRLPHQRRAERMAMPGQSMDIAPTLLHALGVSIPAWMDGAPLTEKRDLEGRETIVVNFKDPADGKIFRWPTKVAILWKQYKMIVSCDSKRVELYDLGRDPGEETNLSLTEVSMVKELVGKLKQHLAKQRRDHALSCSIV